jgi:hypothetical protein
MRSISWAALLALLALCACDDDPQQGAINGQIEDDAGDQGEDIDLGGDDLGEEVGPDAAADLEPDLPPAPYCGDGACDAATEDLDGCPRDCDPAPVALHDPASGELLSYPDDFFTVSEDTPTGLRVDIPVDSPTFQAAPALFQKVFPELSTLDGFGISAGSFLRFSRPLDPASVPDGEATGAPESAILFGYLDEAGAFVRVPVELIWTDEGSTMMMQPMRPLPPRARALAGVTRALRGADGRAAAPGPALKALLAGQAQGPLSKMNARYEEALGALTAAGAISGPDDVAALTVFTTQSTWHESLEIAHDIQTRPHMVAQRLGCEERARYRVCELTFQAGNYRDAARVVRWEPGGGPQGMYEIPVTVYLPLEPAEGLGELFPVSIFGHGLAGEREQAGRLADFAAPLGIATVSIDAAEHGQHPAAMGGDRISKLLSFFGFQGGVQLSALQLRDNWRQSTYDKLALVELLKGGVDVDGDGAVDLDGERIMYLGVSLGGIMGSELLALSQDVHVGVLVVAGARVTDILQFSALLGPVVELLSPSGVTEGDIARFFPVLQTIVDRPTTTSATATSAPSPGCA